MRSIREDAFFVDVYKNDGYDTEEELIVMITATIDINNKTEIKERVVYLNVPNDETLEAIREGNEIIESGKTRFDTAEEMFRALKS